MDCYDFDLPLIIDKHYQIKTINLNDIYVKNYLIYFKRPGYFIYSLITSLMYSYPDLYIDSLDLVKNIPALLSFKGYRISHRIISSTCQH